MHRQKTTPSNNESQSTYSKFIKRLRQSQFSALFPEVPLYWLKSIRCHPFCCCDIYLLFTIVFTKQCSLAEANLFQLVSSNCVQIILANHHSFVTKSTMSYVANLKFFFFSSFVFRLPFAIWHLQCNTEPWNIECSECSLYVLHTI